MWAKQGQSQGKQDMPLEGGQGRVTEGTVLERVSEGLAGAAMQMLKDEIMKSTAAKIGYFLAET